jgi:hypothetical protein
VPRARTKLAAPSHVAGADGDLIQGSGVPEDRGMLGHWLPEPPAAGSSERFSIRSSWPPSSASPRLPLGRVVEVHTHALIALRDVFKSHVLYRVRVPAAVIEVPPLELINRESLCLHMPPQVVAYAALLSGSAGVVRIRPFRCLVVQTRHAHRAPRSQVVERQVHSATAIVA